MEPRDDSHDRERRLPISGVPDEAPDPVETRDPRVRPVPVSRGRAWLYVIPAVLIVILGVAWMTEVERTDRGDTGPRDVTGTSGERSTGPEAAPARGDETPLNAPAMGPRVISEMDQLSSKDEYLGRAVDIAAVPVMTVPGPRTFWVGRITNRTLVLVDRSAQDTRVAAGQIVRLSGRLESPPSSAELAHAGLSADDREALDGEKVIIRATRVEPQASAGANQAEMPRR